MRNLIKYITPSYWRGLIYTNKTMSKRKDKENQDDNLREGSVVDAEVLTPAQENALRAEREYQKSKALAKEQRETSEGVLPEGGVNEEKN